MQVSVNVHAPAVLHADEWMQVKTTFQHVSLSRPSFNKSKPDFNPDNPEGRWIRGLPGTYQYQGARQAEQNFVLLTSALQWHWYTQCVMMDPGHNNAYYFPEWISLTKSDRWTTNGAGSDLLANHITGDNLDKGDMQFFTLTTSLALLKKIGPAANIYGTMSYPFEAINANASLSGISITETPWLYYWACNEFRIPILNAKGKWPHGQPEYIENGYEAFPQFHGLAPTPLYMPETSTGWIACNDVRVLEVGEKPTMFNN